MLRLAVILFFFAILELSTTTSLSRRAHTHPPRHTHATKSHDGGHHHHVHTTQQPGTLFNFDSQTLSMLASNGDSCYIYVLKIEEFDHMKTPTGIRQIEEKIDNLIGSNNGTLVPVNTNDIAHEFHRFDYKHCGLSKLYIIK